VDYFAVIAAERRTMADTLDGLTPQQWGTESRRVRRAWAGRGPHLGGRMRPAGHCRSANSARHVPQRSSCPAVYTVMCPLGDFLSGADAAGVHGA
jgi:hypothetical protein